MNISGMIRGLAGNVRAAEPKALELKPGQVVKGVVLQVYDNQEAQMSIDGVQVRVKLEAQMSQGQTAWLQVQPESPGGQIVLKPAAAAAVPVTDEELGQMLRQTGLKDTPVNRELVQLMRQNGLPLTKESAAPIQDIISRMPASAKPEQWLQTIGVALSKGLPMTTDTVSALHQTLFGKPFGDTLKDLSQAIQSALNKGMGEASGGSADKLLRQLGDVLRTLEQTAGSAAGKNASAGSGAGGQAAGSAAPGPGAALLGQGAANMSGQAPASTGGQAVVSAGTGQPAQGGSPAGGTIPAAGTASGAAHGGGAANAQVQLGGSAAGTGGPGPGPGAGTLPQGSGAPGQGPAARASGQSSGPAAAGQPAQAAVHAGSSTGAAGTAAGAAQGSNTASALPASGAGQGSTPPAALGAGSASAARGGQAPGPGAAPGAVQAQQAASGTGAEAPGRNPAGGASAAPAGTAPAEAGPARSAQPISGSQAAATDNGWVRELLRAVGVDHESRLLKQLGGSQAAAGAGLPGGARAAGDMPLAAWKPEAAETLKSLLLQLSTADGLPASLRDSVQQAVQHITGQQLLMSQDKSGMFTHMTLFVPLLNAEGQPTAAIHIQSRKGKRGELDAENCRLLFDLDMKSLGSTLVDVQVMNRIVSLQVFNDMPFIGELLNNSREEVGEALGKLGYQFLSLKASPFPDTAAKKDSANSLPLSRTMIDTIAPSVPYQGVDFRI
ncbi:hypothetical protein [Paenibacillus lutrae]|uniref:Uncharacterized protein n=1 Tax=Paenibacillus lutrae TaxID=2078573 RepID=A0A7X3FGS1_9BACL|nr:hypothetical protein [Paenibacillus lutrae]MVO99178.1 hypothetical protein [Paenibacillus lutrae]